MARLWKRKGNCVMWTERNRLLLIETIIQVEKEMMHKSIRAPIGKWKHITYLLAQKFKGRSEAAPILEKCKNGFHSICLQYRRYLVSGTPCPMLTERVLEMMKNWDDLINVAPISVAQSKSASTGQAARKFSLDHAKKSDRKHESLHYHKNTREVERQGDLHKSRERHKAAGASFESVSISSKEGPGGHDKPASSTGGSRRPRLVRESEDPADLAVEPGLRRSARFEASTRAQASTRPPSRESGPFLKRCPRFKWTERERVLLIEIVIQVEEEKRQLGNPVNPSNGIQIGKWERINCLLPRNLQAQSEKCKKYRCASMFHHILTDYKAHLQGKSPGSYHTLTKPILETMKKRENLLNGVTTSVRDSKSISRQQTATSFSLDHANYSERNQEGLHFDKNAGEIKPGRQGDLIKPWGRHDTSTSVPQKKHFSGRATENPNYHDKPASSTGGSKPRLVRESKDSDLDLPERSGRPGAQTRAQNSRRPSSQKSGPSYSYNRQCNMAPPMAPLKKGTRIEWTAKDRVLLIQTVIQVEQEIMQKLSVSNQPSTTKKTQKWERINSLLPPKLQGVSKGVSTYRCRSVYSSLVRRNRAYLCPKRGKNGRSHPMLSKALLTLMKKREDQLNGAPNSAWQSTSTTQHAASSFSSDHAKDRSRSDHNKSKETQNGGAARSVSMTKRSRGDLNRSGKRHNDPEDLGEPSDAQTQAQTSSEPPTGDASSTRKSTSTSTPHTAFEERRQEVTSNDLLRRLDMEFSELTSWVENQLIPLGKKDCNQMAIPAIRSSKRRKLSDTPSTQPLDSIFDESLSRKADLHIQMKFQNLRVELAQLLKRTSVDVAQVFIQT